jgi:hypothetical protein
MGAIPGSIETDQQPPMTIPLRHFLVGILFLLAGTLLGVGLASGVVPGFASLVHVHLLLVGWVCVTIMGAMTQFVPVWSGVALHSRRLASLQLTLVVAGLVGFAGALLLGRPSWLLAFGGAMLAGFWTFVYNVGRTLGAIDGAYDVTERHFVLALGFFVVLTALGYGLALDFTVPLLEVTGQSRVDVRAAHATIAVFGAVLTTVYGALYQLGTMFTQTELHGVDLPLQRIEEVAHPVGVVLLAVGRYADWLLVGRIGGVLVLVAALGVSVVLARKLYEMRVPWTPMHTRYGVVATALAAWALGTAPAWLRDPTTAAHLIGAPGTTHLLALGVIGFVVLGTLYHIVPFIVWVHRYSDRLGYEDVPMIDDLYRDRLAALDASLLVGGTTLLVVSETALLPGVGAVVGGALVGLGVVVFAANTVLVLRAHSPHSLGEILFGSMAPARTGTGESRPADQQKE